MRARNRAWVTSIVAVAAFCGLTNEVMAQGEGQIAATVVESGTSRPLAGAQVFIAGARIGGVTGADGKVLLTGVASGTTEIRVRLIGYAPLARAATVSAGETTTLQLELTESAVSLDEMVVTGTAGQARRREVGNSITQLNVAEKVAPTLDAEQMLQGQAAGVKVMESGAQMGSGRQIRLRGSVSVAMSNQPLIYVDGVRMRSDMLPQNMLPTDAAPGGIIATRGSGPGTAASALNDINPDDIERIEIVKGAAATTLYGTEAASGVIQIFTKRGRPGDAAWALSIGQGISELRQPFGTPEKKFMGLDPWMKRGWSQAYSLSVSGGKEDLGYFVSAAHNNDTGVFPDDWQRGVNGRGNFNFRPRSSLNIDWNTSVTKKTIQNVPMGNLAEGLTLNVYRSPSNYIGSDKVEDIDRLFEQEWLTEVNHLISGVTFRHALSTSFTHRLTVGYDRIDSDLRGTLPYGFITDPGGLRSDRRWSSELLTVDYAATYEANLPRNLSGRFSIGGQSVSTEISSVWGLSEDFPGPGEPTLSSGAKTRSFEDRTRVINAGVFGEALFGLKDRYFLTLGARADGNTAFGENLGLQVYPKVSASYVVSEEPFFPSGLGLWKLRAAYGRAGRAPGAFDAVRTWKPVGWAGRSAFLPNTVGNPDLGPERTSELELGFDAALFNGRLSLSLNYYNSTTNDALLPVGQSPSLGFSGTQLENVGTIKNRGVEMSLTGSVLETPSLGWTLGLSFAHNSNDLIDLGGSAGFLISETGWAEEGQPVPVIIGTRLANPDDKAEPILESDYHFGANIPSNTVGLTTSLAFKHGIELSAVAEYMGGNYLFDRASRNMAQRGVWAPCQGPGGGYALLADGRRDELTAFERLTCDPKALPRDFMNFPGDFIKLRNVTLKLPAPTAILPGTASGTLSVSLRNIRLWKHADLPLFDPEMAGVNGAGSPVRAIVEQVPSPMTLLFTLRLGF